MAASLGIRSTRALLQPSRYHHPGTNLPRSFRTSASAMVEAKDLSISPGADVESLVQETTALVDDGRWTVCNEGKGLERTIRFKTFKTTWDFMTSVAQECKAAKHHPEWTNVYNRVHVRWTTHSPEGLSGKDTRMAGICDREAEKFGETVVEGTRDWKAEVKDCCGGGGEGERKGG